MSFYKLIFRSVPGVVALLLLPVLLTGAGNTSEERICAASNAFLDSQFLRQQKLVHSTALSDARIQQDDVTAYAQESIGDIAIIEATPDILAPPNPFDLSMSSLHLTPMADGYSVRPGNSPVLNAAFEGGVQLSLDDDDAIAVRLPFPFQYYNMHFRTAYVHSDGNITFEEPEASSFPRSYSRAAIGPPRIAGLFRDLDPSSGGKVSFHVLSDRAVISWYQVPIFTEGSVGARQTFQTMLYRDGRIEFLYENILVEDAVVGVFPGDVSAQSMAVDFSAGMTAGTSGIVAEIFSQERRIDDLAVSLAFYRSFEDTYDFLIVFNELDFNSEPDAIAYAITVRNEVQGIGNPTYDLGNEFGSITRLSSFINMGAVSQYPLLPEEIIPGLRYSSLIKVLAHETGHRFLAYPLFVDPATGRRSASLLGRQYSHWNFFFNSEASFLEGNRIRDAGVGVSPRFQTIAANQQFSLLDQYLMGLRPASEVPGLFLVDRPQGSGLLNETSAPLTRIKFNGIRKDIMVSDIIAVEGQRRPDFTVAQRNFRFVFALVIAEGTVPSSETIQQLQALQALWKPYFEKLLEPGVTAETSLVKQLNLSTWPAGGLLLKSTGNARISIAKPRQTDLTINLDLSSGIARVPAAVTLRAGQTQVDFELTGTSVGIATLSASATEAGYDRAVSRLKVKDGYDGLKLSRITSPNIFGIAGAPLEEPVVFQLRDEDLIPYSGVELELSGTEDLNATYENMFTDQDGKITVQWKQNQSSGAQMLNARLLMANDISSTVMATFAQSAPRIHFPGIVNSARLQGFTLEVGYAPGSLVTVYGKNLSTHIAQANEIRFPTQLAGTRVFVNSVAAPLRSVSPDKIEFQLAFELSGNSFHFRVANPFGESSFGIARLSPAQPGIYSDSNNEIAEVELVEQSSGESVLPHAGAVIRVFCTGLGAVEPSGRTGVPASENPLQEIVLPIEAWLDDQPVVVISSALAPNTIGRYYVEFKLPVDLTPGMHSFQIAVNGWRSNTVHFESR